MKSDAFLVIAAVLFVLTWPLEKRHLVYTEYSFVTGAYTEAGTMAVYLSDFAFLFLGLSWLGRRVPRSLRGADAERRRGSSLGSAPALQPLIPLPLFLVGLALVAWSAFRALPLHPSPLGWYGALRVAQGFLLLMIAADIWTIASVRRAILLSLIVGGTIQSAWGVSQVFRGSDLGLRFLGEPELSLTKSAVAKVDILKYSGSEVNSSRTSNEDISRQDEKESGTTISGREAVPRGTSSRLSPRLPREENVPQGTISRLPAFLPNEGSSAIEAEGTSGFEKKEEPRNLPSSKGIVPQGTKVLRAYGSFPHPNVLSAFLSVALFSAIQVSFSQVYVKRREQMFLRELRNIPILIPLFLIPVGILLSFSRSGWLIFLSGVSASVLCSSRNIPWKRLIFPVVLCAFGFLSPLFFPTLRSAFQARIVPPGTDRSIPERMGVISQVSSLVGGRYVSGVGTGNWVIHYLRNERNIDTYDKSVFSSVKEPWQYQYPHAVPAVLFVESGLIGLGLFVLFISLVAREFALGSGFLQREIRDASGTRSKLRMLLLTVALGGAALSLLLFDHFPWTNQQGRILLWGILGVALGTSLLKKPFRPVLGG